MIRITKQERDLLNSVGLLQFKRLPCYKAVGQDSNFVTVNRGKRARQRHTYVSETTEILTVLEKYNMLDLQILTKEQLQQLKDEGLVTEAQIQYPNTYTEKATVFISRSGQIRCKKVTSYMTALGLWRK